MAKVFRDPRMQNAAGRPSYCVLYKGLDGKWHRERTEALDKVQADALLAQKLREQVDAQAKGLQSTDHLKPVPFETFFKEEFLPYQEARLRESSYKRALLYAKHVLPHFGSIPLKAVNAGHVEQFIRDRAKDDPKPSPAEINGERALVSAVMSRAFCRGLVDVNPVARVKPLKEDNAKDRWLTEWEVDQILDKAEAWLKPFIVLAVNTGLRREELTSLTWGDVDLDQGFIRVGAESKSHKARYVPINSVSRHTLKEALQLRLRTKGGLTAPVFLNTRRKGAYKPHSVSHGFRRAVLAVQEENESGSLEEVTFHTTRHTFASWLIQRGVPIAEVQEHLGHSSDVMTRRYAHLAPKEARRGSLEVLVAAEASVEQESTTDCAPVAKEIASKREAL
jgi:integrase